MMSLAIPKSVPETAIVPADQPLALIVDAAGISPLASARSARERLAAKAICWIDIFGGDDMGRKELLTEVGLEEIDITWAQRFGQAGRMTIGRQRLRAVTWLAEPTGKALEVHLLCSGLRILTVWKGNGSILDEIRQHFAERISEMGNSDFHAAGILLQLLLGTLDHSIRGLDAQLDRLRMFEDGSGGMDLGRLALQRQELQAEWLRFNRYGSAVRSAVIGIEVV